MGLKHLRVVKEFLKKHAPTSFSTSELKAEFRMNHNTALDVLAYLIQEKSIKEITKKEVKRYRWKNE